MRSASPFAIPVYRALWAFNLLSQTGLLVQSVGASWAIAEGGASPQLVALVQTAASLPLVLLSPMSGAISDRLDRRAVTFVAQFVVALTSLGLALLAWSGLASPLLMIGCVSLVGCCMAFNGPALLAMVGDVVPRRLLPDAVVYNAIGLNLARIGGPAIGGAIVAAGGAAASFAFNAVSSLALIATLARWRPPRHHLAETPEALGQSILGGMIFAWNAAPIRTAIFRSAIFAASLSAIPALLPLVARDLLGAGAATFGMLLGSYGVGALAGAFASARIRTLMTPESAVRLASLIGGPAAIGVACSPAWWLAASLLAIAGAAWVLSFSIFNVAVQLASPRRFAARALSLYQMSVFTGVALGSWLGGLYADHLGIVAALLLTGLMACASIMAGLWMPLLPVHDHEHPPVGF